MPLDGIWRTLGRVGNIIGIIGAFVAQARGPGPAATLTTERPHEPADLKGEAIETRRSQTATQQGSGVAAPVG